MRGYTLKSRRLKGAARIRGEATVENEFDNFALGSTRFCPGIPHSSSISIASFFVLALTVENSPLRWEILDAALHTDGQFLEDLAWDGSSALRMNGLSVILQASRKILAAISEVLARQNVAARDVQVFLLHQANQNLLVRVAKALGAAPEKVFSNVVRYGNPSPASMLIAAAEWATQNPPAGDIVFGAFEAGFHWGALLARSR